MRMIPMLLLAVLAAGAAFAVTNHQRERARHFFLEGSRLEAEGKMDEAYEYYRRAWSEDSSYAPASFAYGSIRLGNRHEELAEDSEFQHNLSLLRTYVDRYPADYYSSAIYAYMAGMIDTTGENIRVLRRTAQMHPEKSMALVQLAEAYAQRNEVDSAVASLDRYERIEGVNPNVTLRKAAYRLYGGDTIAALGEIDRLIASNPRSSEYVGLKGDVFGFISKPDSALKYYLAAERIAPESGHIKQSLANWYRQAGDSANYDLKTYESLISEDLDLESKLSTLAGYLQDIITGKQDTQRGDSLFRVLNLQYPHNPEILSLASRYSAAKHDFADAIEKAGYAIDLDKENEQLWMNLMLYQMSGEHPRDAMATYRRAEATLPQLSRDIRYLYANSASMAEEPDSAILMLDRLIRDEEPHLSVADSLSDADKVRFRNLSMEQVSMLASYYQTAGDVYQGAKPKRMQDAFRSYENALFFDPDNVLTLNNYAYFIIEYEHPAPDSPRFAKAKEMSHRAVTLNDQQSTYLDTYAWILFKEGEYKEALQYQQAAIEKEKEEGQESSELYSHYGDILFMNGKPAEALKSWQKALELEPDNELLKKKVKHKTYFYE